MVEGVGLFDGRIEAGTATVATGSTAHVAGLIGAPVVLVVDARSQSHSIAALLHGFSTFDTATRVGGVILNRVGSPRHEQVLRQACESAGIAAVLGAVPRVDEIAVPSRHLGLITAVEHGRRATAAVAAMTNLITRHVDLAAVAALAERGCPPRFVAPRRGRRTGQRCTPRWRSPPDLLQLSATPNTPELLRAAGRASSNSIR